MRAPSARISRVVSQVWKLSLPIVAANLLQSLVNLVDVFLAGRLGPIEIAGVGLSNSIFMLVLVGVMAVTTGAMSLAALARGAGDEDELSRVAKQALSLGVLTAVLLSVLGFAFSEQLLSFLNSDGDPRAVEIGTGYLRIMFAGTVFMVLNVTINALMQGAGDTVTPLKISAVMNVLNIVFSALLMFGLGPIPAMGVMGIALGTILSRVVAAAAGLWLFYSGRNVVRILQGSYWPDWDTYRQILSIGIPSGFQGVARNGAQILVVRIVTSTAAGTYGATALSIGLQIESLAFMPGLALSIAATSLVGQALGAWQVDEARLRGNVSLAVGTLLMTAIGTVLFIFAPQLVLLFDPTAHPTVLEAGTSYLRINALSQPILAVAMILNGTLRGAGDTRAGMVGTIVGRWLVVVPVSWLLAFPMNMGVEGVWWALFIGTAVQASWVAFRWWSNVWPRVGLRKTRLYRLHLRHLPEHVQESFLNDVKAPLMAAGDAQERVTDERVSYQLPEGKVVVEFGDGFTVVEGEELLHGANGRTGDAPEGPLHQAEDSTPA